MKDIKENFNPNGKLTVHIVTLTVLVVYFPYSLNSVVRNPQIMVLCTLFICINET